MQTPRGAQWPRWVWVWRIRFERKCKIWPVTNSFFFFSQQTWKVGGHFEFIYCYGNWGFLWNGTVISDQFQILTSRYEMEFCLALICYNFCFILFGRKQFCLSNDVSTKCLFFSLIQYSPGMIGRDWPDYDLFANWSFQLTLSVFAASISPRLMCKRVKT